MFAEGGAVTDGFEYFLAAVHTCTEQRSVQYIQRISANVSECLGKSVLVEIWPTFN